MKRWALTFRAGFAVVLIGLVALPVGFVTLALWADKAYPPRLENAAGLSRLVLDRDGRLLRAYSAPDGRWRLPVSLDEVDPHYIDMLIAYEDRRFYDHHGVDPLAMARAAWQFVSHGGRIVSGGSTLSMQVARLVEPRERRSIGAKLRQIGRAIQLERRMSKRQILELYLTLAPYGGNLEGVRAASLAWFGREPKKLSLSQSALLVALPQLPEFRRPDRYPEEARAARNRVLVRMKTFGLLPEFEVIRASDAKMPTTRHALPDLAPHLADRALAANPATGEIRLSLDSDIQSRLEQLALEEGDRLGRRQSLAMVMADAATGQILASVGSTSYLDSQRFGGIDMTRAVRSPGSTLKPFIYGLAFETAVVAPETLIDDAPANFGGYRPKNFDMSYQGEVSVRQALQLSLNVPAVRLLEAVSPSRLLGRFKRGGVDIELPPGDAPGLAIGLGGAGLSLRQLVQLYTALANGGRAVELFDGIDAKSGAGGQAPVLETNAAWQVSDILTGSPVPRTAPRLAIAYKTGTSYGYRDAWSIGFDGRHVIGVWVGRADAAPSPGISGLETAAPILFKAFARSGVKITKFAQQPRGYISLDRANLPFALKKFLPNGSSSSQSVKGPEIVYPPAGARVDLGQSACSDRKLPLIVKLQGGKPPYQWIANGRSLAGQTRRRKLTWQPDGPGASNLTVIDAVGQAASVSVFID